jgi:hypothetical protein
MLQNAGNTIMLSKQLSYFRLTKAEMDARAGAHAVSSLLSRFFLIGVGSNDMFVFAAAPDDNAAAAFLRQHHRQLLGGHH